MNGTPHPRGIVSTVAAISCLLCARASALGAEGELSVSTSVGVLYGLAQELVYDPSVSPRHTVSRLDWAMQPVFFSAASLEARASFGLSGSLALTAGIPAPSGSMTDSDYLNYDDPPTLTHFSRHACHTESALLLEARLGWAFRLGGAVVLEPYGAFGLTRVKWSARDGYLQYPSEISPPYSPWDPAREQVRLYGTGIIYEQDYICPSLGLKVRLRPIDRFEAAVGLTGSPYLVCTDVDSHILRQVDFHERLAGGFALEPSVTAACWISGRAKLALELSYRHVGALVGSSYEVSTGVEGLDPGAGQQSAAYPESAGVTLRYLRASLGLSLSY